MTMTGHPVPVVSATHCPVFGKFGDPVDGPRVLRVCVVLRVHVLPHGRAADDVEGAVGDARGHVGGLSGQQNC